MDPVRIQSQLLRERRTVDPAFGAGLFSMTDANDPNLPHTRGRWRQSDVKRAIAAAEQAGLAAYRVEIAPDGTISIVVGMSSGTDDHVAGEQAG